jgi:hypothetical protein
LLIEEQKENCEALERDLDFLLKIITHDETCYCVQPRNKAGGISVEEFMTHMSKNARQVSSDMKSIFVCPLRLPFFFLILFLSQACAL